MFATIEITNTESLDSIKKKFYEKWSSHKVLHITGYKLKNVAQLRQFYDQFMLKMGVPAAVGEDASCTARDSARQRTGQRWTEIRYDPQIQNAYRHSSNPQPLHTDGSYVPEFPDAAIIYCQSSATNGGETVFLDSDELLRILDQENPELLDALSKTVVPHLRSGSRKSQKIIDNDEYGTVLSWNYYCVDPQVNTKITRLKEDFHSFLKNSDSIREAQLPVGLHPGEAVIWKDHRVLHGRNGFKPSKPAERYLWKSAFASHA